MINAEAVASDDSALIFSRISLRERSTVDRLASASARLPPVFCWMAMTMAKKRSFRGGHALVHLLQRLVQGHAHADILDQAAEFAGQGLRRSRGR